MLEGLLPHAATLLAKTIRLRWKSPGIEGPAVIMFWHGKMFAGWYSVRDAKPVALVSKSKDGGFLAAVLEHWGYRLARGSSGKNGREALDDAMHAVRIGAAKTLVITPDGPRGPFHRFKRGAFQAAIDLGLPLYMLRITYHSPIVFTKSWDSFELPKPFSRVTIETIRVPIEGYPQGLDEQRMWLDRLSTQFQ